jgi:hypothetical protein
LLSPTSADIGATRYIFFLPYFGGEISLINNFGSGSVRNY